jgi:hypothetical protein
MIISAKTLLIIFIILQVLDVYTTKKSMSMGGVETNPPMKYLIDKLGLTKALVLKLILTGGVGTWFAYSHPEYLVWFNIAMLGVVIWNYRVIRSLKERIKDRISR